MPRAIVRALGLAGALLARESAAQTPEPAATPSPAQTFPADVQLVTVDVVVLDQQGRPFAGLGLGDFSLLEDGRPQVLTNFEAVRPAHEGEPARPDAATPAGAALPPTLRPAPFVIVFDELHLSAEHSEQARRSVRQFLETAPRDGDEVTLVATGQGSTWTARLPQGREELLARLASLRGRVAPDSSAERLTEYEAMRIQVFGDRRVEEAVRRRIDVEQTGRSTDYGALGPARRATEQGRAGLSGPQGDPYVRLRAAEVYGQSTLRHRSALAVIEGVLDSLAPVRGRKTVVLVSEGFVYDPTLAEIGRLLRASLRANAALSFLDIRGLESDLGSRAEHGAPPVTVPRGGDAARLFASTGPGSNARDESAGSEYLADETGGVTLRNRNALGGEIARLGEQARTYYLLGYQPSNAARDGRFRRLEVRVRVPDLSVWARKGYYAPGGTATKGEAAPASSTETKAVASKAVSRYLGLVDRYRHGDFRPAVTALADWSPDAVGAVVSELVRARGAGSCGPRCLQAAALLHTETMALEADRRDKKRAALHLETARRLLEIGPHSEPFSRQWHLAFGYHLARLNHLTEALDELEACRKRFGADGELLLGIGTLHEILAFAQKPTDSRSPAPAQSPRAAALRQAEKVYREAIEQAPGLEEAHLRLGRVLQEREKPKDAGPELAWVVDHGRNALWRSLAHLFLGAESEREGSFIEAARRYKAATEAFPGSQSARLALSQALFLSGDRTAAADAVRAVFEQRPPAKDPWLAYLVPFPERFAALWQSLRAGVRP